MHRYMEGAGVPEVMVGWWNLRSWIEVFWSCHSVVDGAVIQWAWPDGKSLLQQMALTVFMMKALRSEAQRWVNDQISDSMKPEARRANG